MQCNFSRFIPQVSIFHLNAIKQQQKPLIKLIITITNFQVRFKYNTENITFEI